MPAEEVYGIPPPSVAPERPEHPEQMPRGWRDRLLAAVLPAGCLHCGEPLPAAAELGLCAPCRGGLRPLSGSGIGDVCALCAAPLGAAVPAGYACGRCRARPPAYDRLLALWSYQPPLDAVVRGLKFGRLDYLGRHLGRELAAAFLAELAPVDLVVPVPLHWRRRLARGYNQAERIARPLALALGRPLVSALSRRRPTPPQSALGRAQRLANPRGAFRVSRRHAVAGRAVLLVDDVATTGATLDAAAAALKRAGAAAVLAAVAGRTP